MLPPSAMLKKKKIQTLNPAICFLMLSRLLTVDKILPFFSNVGHKVTQEELKAWKL